MIMDALNLLDGSYSAAGVLSGSSCAAWNTGSYTSANIIDTSNLASSSAGQGRDVGIGDDLQLVIEALTAITGAANSTLTVAIQTAPDNGSGAPGAWTTLEQTPALPVGTAGIAAGTELLRVPMPLGIQKFIQVQYTVGTANVSAGSVVAAIVLDREALGPNLGYKSGYSNQYI